jgi:GntR family transcriptional regulator/MocR family aminotransferase
MEKRGKLSRYDYLTRCIKGDILSGRLGAGEKLPSKRALAQHLQVAVVTVENAYAQLVAEGYLDPREKRGYFVRPLEAKLPPPPLPEGPVPVTGQKEDSWLLDLRSGGVGTEGFPFSVWAKLTRRVLTEKGEDLLRSTPHNGALELRQAISRHLYQFRGIAAAPEQIVVGAGTEYLYNLIVQLLGRELVYGLEDPGYSKAYQVYRLSGARTADLPVDRQGVPPEALGESGAQVLHISPNHQFPTGVVTPIGRRQSYLRWAEEGNYIIEDDYDSEFRFTGRPIPTLKSIDRGGRVLYVNTFSRSLAPSLRIGYLVLPPQLVEEYSRRLGFYSCTVPAIEQYTLADFLDQGHFDSHVSRMRLFYRSRRDRVMAAIRESALGGRCRVRGEDAGLHFLLELDTEKEDRELYELAQQQGVRLSFLSHYQRLPTPDCRHTLVINYPGVPLDRLEQGLDILGKLL